MLGVHVESYIKMECPNCEKTYYRAPWFECPYCGWRKDKGKPELEMK